MAFKLAAITLAILFVIFSSTSSSASDQLRTDFYDETCPHLFEVVRDVVLKEISQEERMGASLLRLHFHDCFVNGCDASILLDNTTNNLGEKDARPNKNSVRGFDVVDRIKAAVEKNCSNTVSCADILAIAARDSVDILGGCRYNVSLGRWDSKTANLITANSGSIPPPTSSLANLTQLFNRQGLSQTDLVALSGAHSIGEARCTTFKDRIYNDTNINYGFAIAAQKMCPRTPSPRDNNTKGLDETPTIFDNTYFKDLVEQKGLLHSDQELYNSTRNGTTDQLVQKYVDYPDAFMKDFANAMIKMGNIGVLTGNDQGEIRKNCRVRN